jgi:hypothetical protein
MADNPSLVAVRTAKSAPREFGSVRLQPDPSMANRPQLTSALPDSGHRFSELLANDVQVPLRLLDVGMPDDQLNRADVDAVGQEPASALVTQIVPLQVDLPQLLSIDASALLRSREVVTICPRRSDSQAVRNDSLESRNPQEQCIGARH